MICEYKTLFIDLYGVILKDGILDEGFLDFSESVKGKYDVVLLTNGNSQEIKQIIENYGIGKYFSATLISDKLGCEKPSLKVFDAALETIGRNAQECILVDCQAQNLLAAEEVGISAMLFNRSNENFDGMSVCSFKELIDIIG